MVASTRSDTCGRERIAAASGARGEAVDDDTVGARDARRGREAAVGTLARGPDSALKVREWRDAAWARGSHAATAC
jgi:hypothetical protein